MGREILASKSLKSVSRRKEVFNFSTAKHVGIAIDATNPDNLSYVREFRNYLSDLKIDTFIIGYVNGDEIHSNLRMWENCLFICNRDLNLFFKPKIEKTKEFLEKKFDILIDLTLKEGFPLKYLVSLSDSTFKVGRYFEKDNDIDFMIDISKQPSIEYLIEQIKIYVSLINNPVKGRVNSEK